MNNIDLKRISPMMRHYLTLKDKYKDSILLFRLGDFYEMFFEDAEVASRVLDLTLTGRDCGLDERAPMCGVPYHAVEGYISRLVDKGYRVAICEQLTTPQESKGMVERDVVRVITPGTVTEDSMLIDNQNNYIASVYIDDVNTGVCWADISTGEFNVYQFQSDNNLKTLEDILTTIKPREIISNEQAYMLSSGMNIIKSNDIRAFTCYYNWAYDYNNAYKSLCKQFKVQSLDSYEVTNKKYAVSAAGAMIEYFNETQKRTLEHINRISIIKHNSYMFLDMQTRRNLELTETIRERKRKGSLLWLIDNTSTNMGSRELKKWVDQPLIDEKDINLRLDSVEELIIEAGIREEVRAILPKIRDLERLAGKISYGSINPRDCMAIGESLAKLPELKNALSKLKTQMLQANTNNIDLLEDITSLLINAINPNPPMVIKDGGYIKDGYNEELDELRNIRRNGEQWIAKIEATEKEITGIKNLKIGYNKVFGYYLEAPKSASDKVPFRYVRKQTLANCERYITDELKTVEDKVLNAENNAINLENKLYNQIKETLSTIISSLQTSARAISAIDVLCSLAVIAVNNRYTKPIINSKIKHIKINEGRHPVVESTLSTNEYVSNDTLLDNKDNATMIITGPNMAGKSTYMRQVALITLLAHIGSYVPAKSAEISITDRIFTRVGASDDVAFGQSTFMVEMTETALILNNATPNSLLILDEIGRGTSTYDGLSIAWAVMEYITSRISAKALFATHYHELTELEGTITGVKNYKILVNEHKGGIVFLHKIVRGGTNKSFGIEVASLAGVPEEVITRAKQIAKSLEANDNKDSNGIMLGSIGLKESNLKQISFITENKESEILRELKDITLDNCTPMQAFMMLSELVEKAKK